jgi:predicted extracellular nuclease
MLKHLHGTKNLWLTLILFLSIGWTKAQVDIVVWDFDGSVTTPSTGTGTAATGAGITPNPTNFAAGNPGQAWNWDGWTTAATPDATDYFQFSTATTGYEDIILEFDERRSGTGIRDFSVSYSTDGTTFIPIPATVTNVPDNTQWRSHSFNLAAINALDNQGSIFFRIYGYSAEAASGSWRIDNVKIRGTVVSVNPVINEFVANHVGAPDVNEFIEIFGAANTNYNTLTVVIIEGDGGGAGVIDDVFPLGTTNGNGFWTTGYLNDEIENGTQTILLVENFTGAIGQDLDTNNDGILDTTPWTSVVDAVAINDGGGADLTYGVPVLTPGYDGNAFTVGGASRLPNGTDTNTTNDWTRNDFAGFGLPAFPTATAPTTDAVNTMGAVNSLFSGNNPPVVATAIADQTTAVNGTFSLDINANFSDPDGNTLSFSAIRNDYALNNPLPAWLNFAGGVFSGTPTTNSEAGIYEIRVTADDGFGGTVSDVFKITVDLQTTTPVLNFLSRSFNHTGSPLVAGAEIPAFDPTTNRLFVVNGSTQRIDVFEVSNLGAQTYLFSIDIPTLTTSFTGGAVNSVAVKNGIVAVAVANPNPQLNGEVVLFASNTPTATPAVSTYTVGALPDMLTFTPDGQKILVANEGEPAANYTTDPEGSVSILDISGGIAAATIQTATFTAFNGQAAALRADGVILDLLNGSTVAQDFEPEYITIDATGTIAWVALQENNALATLNIPTATFTSVKGLGSKNHNLVQNSFDPSDRDNINGTGASGDTEIRIRTWNVRGLYMPDAIATFQVGGTNYIVSANEGDGRNYGGSFLNERRLNHASVVLDPTAYPDAATLKTNAVLGRLTIHTGAGDTDSDGDIDQIHAFGARSFSIWDENGNLVYDSGDDFEQITALLQPSYFNASNDNNDFDDRSDNKGPEPEGIAIGDIAGIKYAFVGLERIGGIMVYNISNPSSPQFVEYMPARDFTQAIGNAAALDLGPEGLTFVAAADSPTGQPLLIVSNEVSGTTTIYGVVVPPTLNVVANLQPFTTALNTPSAAQSYTVQGANLTANLDITAPAHFQISLDSVTYATTLSLTPAQAALGVTIYIRYLPTAGTAHNDIVTHVSAPATPVNLNVSGIVVTPIYAIQGVTAAGDAATPLLGNIVTTSGIVVGDFQTDGQMRGFFIQDPTGDGNAQSSDGVFVFVPTTNPAFLDVNIGDRVLVTGRATEFFNVTQIDQVSNITVLATGVALPTPTVVNFPETYDGELEQYEGMYVQINQTMTVAQNYFWGRYGQLSLSAAGRLMQPTQVHLPNSPAAINLRDFNQRNLIVLDDGRTGNANQNPNPLAYVGLDNTVRAGDEVTNLIGVLHYDRINPSGASEYTFHPTAAPTITRTNPRPAIPATVAGTHNVKVASFNVLNYFTLITHPDNRGANNATELQRQRDKLIPALLGLDADVIGLMEISNIPGDNALDDLVNRLNAVAGAGTWAAITHPNPGTDAIKVALIYKPAVVTPWGAAQTIVIPPSRNPIGQTFELVSNGEKFSVLINHLKSKGSCPSDGSLNEDQGDGQGCWNALRTQHAAQIRNLAASLAAAANDDDVIILGDLNSYAMEDPIREFTDNGYTNLADAFGGNASSYSFIFDSYSGSLDHILATASLTAQTTGVTKWHINADEPVVIDYNTEFKFPAVPGSPDYYAANPYRSSDHDPIIVGLNLQPIPPVVVNLNPADNATGVSPTTNLVITFDMPVQAGTGNITISDGTNTLVIPATGNADATVTYNAATNQVIINPTANLLPNTNYYILIDAGAIESAATGADFAGFALATDWNFETGNNPTAGGGGGAPTFVPSPAPLTATPISTSQITLEWTNVPAATNGYEIYVNGVLIATVDAGVITYTVGGLDPNTLYYFQVVALSSNNRSEPARARAYTLPLAPSQVAVREACGSGTVQIQLPALRLFTDRYRIYSDSVGNDLIAEIATNVFETPVLTESRFYYISFVSNGQESERVAILALVAEELPVEILEGERVFFCQGSPTATLTATLYNDVRYIWYRNGLMLGGADSHILQVEHSGVYAVAVVRNNCTFVSAEARVTLDYKPTAAILETNLVFCNEATLNAQVGTNPSDAVYTWFKGSQEVGQGTTFQTTESGTYTLKVLANGCESSVTAEVTVLAPPSSVVLTKAEQGFCAGDSVRLSVPAISGATYIWFKNGLRYYASYNTNRNEIFATDEGVYQVRLVFQASREACVVLSNEVEVPFYEVPKVRLIRQAGDAVLQINGEYNTIAWFFNQQPIAGADNQLAVPITQNGHYQAVITTAEGCVVRTRSNYYALPLGTDDETEAAFHLYPNPTSGIVQIQVGTLQGACQLVLVDALGRTLKAVPFEATQNQTFTLDLSPYANGIYTLQIQHAAGTIVRKIVKE